MTSQDLSKINSLLGRQIVETFITRINLGVKSVQHETSQRENEAFNLN